jgi:formate dehydrogenase subunit delta
MNEQHLVEMANRIGEFFEAMPEHDEALAGIATHIRRFWAPRMRAQLAALLTGADGEPLTPIVREALQRHAWALA